MPSSKLFYNFLVITKELILKNDVFAYNIPANVQGNEFKGFVNKENT